MFDKRQHNPARAAAFATPTQFPQAPPRVNPSPMSQRVPLPAPADSVGILDPHHYATMTQGSLQIGTAVGVTTPQQFLTRMDERRTILILTNYDPNGTLAALLIGLDQQPVTASAAIRIAAGATWIFDTVVPQNDLWVFPSALPATFVTLCWAYATVGA